MRLDAIGLRPVCHWVWGGGWLGSMGLQDFAGGTVVHITAGVAALVAAVMMGSRKGFGSTAMPPHNLTMTVTGAGMLWVGWFGFNAGSALAADNSAAMAMLVTHLSAACGSLAGWRWSGFVTVNLGTGYCHGYGCWLGHHHTGLGFSGPAAAVVIGLTAGVVCYFATITLRNTLKIDDSLDVFPVHGVGGMLGTILIGVFAAPSLGIFSGNGFSDGVSSMGGQLYIQVFGVAVTFLFALVGSWILLKLVDQLIGLRVDDDEETEGLDLVLHDERGYDL